MSSWSTTYAGWFLVPISHFFPQYRRSLSITFNYFVSVRFQGSHSLHCFPRMAALSYQMSMERSVCPLLVRTMQLVRIIMLLGALHCAVCPLLGLFRTYVLGCYSSFSLRIFNARREAWTRKCRPNGADIKTRTDICPFNTSQICCKVRAPAVGKFYLHWNGFSNGRRGTSN